MSAVVAALRAEWVKIRTLRSTVWSLLTAFALCAGLGLLFGLTLRGGFGRMDQEARANFDPVVAGFYSLTIGQIALVVFGVLLVTGEYGGGSIRLSLTAVPRRGMFYGAKVVAGTLTALVFSLVTGFVTFFTAQSALGPHGVSLGAPGVLRAVLFACVYLTLICVFAMGVAAMLRGTALSLGILIPLLFLDSQGVGNLPKVRTVAQFLPDQAGLVMMRVVKPDPSFITYRGFGPWTALGILLAWTAAALAGGLLVLNRRDA
ncbi:ABC transporter permease [Actinomadura sp. DC4]|uniref:ABC transporter permease subunit n=1 Tax=Actinomadura sp. DC4 TaxID=3055069 RepID=UPI0025AF8E5B|nr:ABC transporter permease [Actinomadura sp. DC4]MDN3356689.1 ABC transporter permease subunit [Actinomadura sp. DC4]